MTLILVRHGESEWNAKGLFCGWVDVDLSAAAVEDSHRAAHLIKQHMDDQGSTFDICYTSVLKRSIKTAHIILESNDSLYIPLRKSWRVNERFYGDLTGKLKIEMVEKFGKQQIKKWRRSYNDPPPPIADSNPFHPSNDRKYHLLSDFDISKDLPLTESLYHVIERVKPLWFNEIIPLLKRQLNVLLCIHGTSMRAIIALIEKEYQGDAVHFDTLSKLEIPNGYPVVYNFDENGSVVIGKDEQWIAEQEKVLQIAKIHGRFLGNLDQLMIAQTKVKNQIEKKVALL